jgi:hypothetical protein
MGSNVSASGAQLRAEGAADELEPALAYCESNDSTEDGHAHWRQQGRAECEQADAQPYFQADQGGGDVARLHAGWLLPHRERSFPLQ